MHRTSQPKFGRDIDMNVPSTPYFWEERVPRPSGIDTSEAAHTFRDSTV